MGQSSVFATAAIRRSLSSVSIPHSSKMWSAVWFLFPHGQSGACIILNLILGVCKGKDTGYILGVCKGKDIGYILGVCKGKDIGYILGVCKGKDIGYILGVC